MKKAQRPLHLAVRRSPRAAGVGGVEWTQSWNRTNGVHHLYSPSAEEVRACNHEPELEPLKLQADPPGGHQTSHTLSIPKSSHPPAPVPQTISSQQQTLLFQPSQGSSQIVTDRATRKSKSGYMEACPLRSIHLWLAGRSLGERLSRAQASLGSSCCQLSAGSCPGADFASCLGTCYFAVDLGLSGELGLF